MLDREHFVGLLGRYLTEMAPLITRAVEVLDKPGTLDLRRRLDDRFSNAVDMYYMARRAKEIHSGTDAEVARLPYSKILPLPKTGQPRRKARPPRGFHLHVVAGIDFDAAQSSG